jgi:hypothetical protein
VSVFKKRLDVLVQNNALSKGKFLRALRELYLTGPFAVDAALLRKRPDYGGGAT